MRNGPMELLAPAGDAAALRSAVQNGADAVYLGAGAFNARRGATNFDGEALNDAVRYCHARGVKVHVTLNTLVREEEFAALTEVVRAINCSGADAVIAQDFGVADAVRSIAPEIQLHASTQMAAHNRQAAAFLKRQGFDRVVLARELSYDEIAGCAREGVEIETFVHGALCSACSGQCLMSGIVGGRSGNRGLCAQPCRLPWRLDGREGHLLSTKDLCAIDHLARLRDAGVNSLKIEGRLKRAEYVAVTVAAYRRALDALEAGERFDAADARGELAQMFNRGGFTRGYAPGVAEKELMYPDRPNHMGVRVGESRRDGSVTLATDVLSADVLTLRRQGGDIPVRLSGAADETVGCPSARRGDTLCRLVSDAQMKRARESLNGEHCRIPVTARATLRVGERAALEVSDGEHAARVEGGVIEAATGRGFDAERAQAQLKKTGGTAYAVTELTLDADDNAFCPASLLNALRRDVLAELEARRTQVNRLNMPYAVPATPKDVAGRPLLLAQSSDVGQLEIALSRGADAAVLAPADVRPQALRALDLAALSRRGRVMLALPAVLNARALDGLNAWALENRNCIDATFLSNVGQLGLEWPGARIGDYLLNIANNASVAQTARWGLDGYTPSVELNAGQIASLGGRANLIVWGRIPLMHLRHCPLRSAKGMKGLHADCRHCDVCKSGDDLASKTLIDRKGAAFPLRRVAQPGGCVVQVLNSAPLMPLRRLDRLPGAAAWRLLLDLNDPAETVVRVYRAALDGGDFRTMPEWERLSGMNTTTGHYFRGVE